MGISKRHGAIGSKMTRKTRSHKTAKRRAIKAKMLADRKAKKNR
jgi:hypothetical protein